MDAALDELDGEPVPPAAGSPVVLPADEPVMRCMEVWGGNEPFDAGVHVPGLDAWVYCRPYHGDAAGGDVYFVSSCATGRITRLLVADVSGHGADVAPIGAQLRRLMRRYVNYLDQTAFVRALNRHFTALSAANRFATAVACTFFAPTSHLTLCNAGHPHPLLYRAADCRWHVLRGRCGDGQNMPWGIDEVCDYQQFDLDLDAGDLVLCYTDSLPEAWNADRTAQLGPDALAALVAAVDVSDPSRLTARLLDAVSAAGYAADDDVTVLLFRPTGEPPPTTLGHRVAAGLTLLKGLAASVLPGGGPAPLPDASLANVGGAVFPSLGRRWHGRGGRRGTNATSRSRAE